MENGNNDKSSKVEAAYLKAATLNKRLQERPDIEAQKAIESCTVDLDFSNYESLMISKEALDYVNERGYPLPSVFAHPRLLQEMPMTSLHYRGISGLSLKSVKRQVCVDAKKLEQQTTPVRESQLNQCQKLACLYNMMTSFVITDSLEWTLDNGYRSVIATLGITIDGQMRNKVGQLAEARIKQVIMDHLEETGRITSDMKSASVISLSDNSRIAEIRFGSEPDVGFYDNDGNPLVVIEIKGGLDPAGALERLGAVQKTATEARRDHHDCKVFLVAGVITPEMKTRLEAEEKIVENYFDFVEIMKNKERRAEFLAEIFSIERWRQDSLSSRVENSGSCNSSKIKKS